jgi:hypothetical protein
MDTDELPEESPPVTERPVYAHARPISEFFPEVITVC